MTRDIYESENDKLHQISEMIKVAEKHNLLCEVILSFGIARSRGNNTDRSTAVALNEWDI